jgi:hypothetical protein
MPYGITQLRLDKHLFVEISKENYDEIVKSKDYLLEVLDIEEKLNIILDNYLELEMELLNSSVEQMLFSNQNSSWFSNQRNQINRRIVNLLTACRLYLDHIFHHLNTIYGRKTPNLNSVKQKISEEYDLYLEYRVMEALRNYVQHRGFPIHIISSNTKKIENGEKYQLQYTLTPQINIQELEYDKKFKRKTLDEMKSLGETFDIKPIVRVYIESIGKIHVMIREMLSEDIASWEKNLFHTMEDFQKKYGDDLIGLAIVSLADNGNYEETIPLSKTFIERRAELEAKNRNFNGLSLKYATNQIIE